MTGKTAQIIDAVKPVLVTRGGKVSSFLTNDTDPDAADKAWISVDVDETAPNDGDLYTRLLAYLTDPAPSLALSHDPSVADLAAAWAAAPAITS